MLSEIRVSIPWKAERIRDVVTVSWVPRLIWPELYRNMVVCPGWRHPSRCFRHLVSVVTIDKTTGYAARGATALKTEGHAIMEYMVLKAANCRCSSRPVVSPQRKDVFPAVLGGARLRGKLRQVHLNNAVLRGSCFALPSSWMARKCLSLPALWLTGKGLKHMTQSTNLSKMSPNTFSPSLIDLEQP